MTLSNIFDQEVINLTCKFILIIIPDFGQNPEMKQPKEYIIGMTEKCKDEKRVGKEKPRYKQNGI